MKRLLVSALVIGAASSAFAAGFYVLPGEGEFPTYSISYTVAATPDGKAYVSGQAHDGSVYRSAYWTYSNGSVSSPTFLPANKGGTISTNSFALDVFPDGSLVVAGRHGAAGTGGAATWTNKPGAVGQDANGWRTHFLNNEIGNTGTHIAMPNTMRVASDGVSYYAFGKSSNSQVVGTWLVNTTTGESTWDAFGGMSGSSSVNSITPTGIAVGTTRNAANVVNGYVHTSSGTTLLPVPAGGDGRTEAYDIAGNGNVIVGAAMYGGILYQSYWYKSGDSWVAEWLEDVPGATSTCAALAVNEDGTLAGGYGYINGVYHAWIWDLTELNQYGQPVGMPLGDYLAGYGISGLPEGLTIANRITSIKTVNGVTYITGYGNGGNVGFLAVVPEPATAIFVLLGGLALVRRRR
ncbi:MAG TPA: PEP-CTERM sorting domain-containing protein [Phycisphaerae bacterium]|mgnify:CR=1 FL=1|nr:PEP-CTERM sorting domain-containing protein [Phycisphaerae bacterium]